MKTVFIVIPTYNESVIIGAVIQEIKKTGYSNIIVVDDGSSDQTYQEAKKKDVIVVRHILNRGKGAAAKTGIEAAKLLHADCIITFDGDGQHDPKDIGNIIKNMEEGYDVVLGSRLMKNKEMPMIKIIANYIGNFFTWLMYGIWVSDSQSGFRGYSKKAIDLIDTKHDRYEYDSEIIREISRNNLKFCEVPVHVRYTKYSQQKIHKQGLMNGIKTVIRIIISA